jgi:hypothetical protein
MASEGAGGSGRAMRGDPFAKWFDWVWASTFGSRFNYTLSKMSTPLNEWSLPARSGKWRVECVAAAASSPGRESVRVELRSRLDLPAKREESTTHNGPYGMVQWMPVP